MLLRAEQPVQDLSADPHLHPERGDGRPDLQLLPGQQLPLQHQVVQGTYTTFIQGQCQESRYQCIYIIIAL